MLVTNDLTVTEASLHSPSTTSYPEALILEPYSHKNFTTIVINSLDTREFQVATSLPAIASNVASSPGTLRGGERVWGRG